MKNFITKLLNVSQRYSFINPVLNDHNSVNYFKYGPLGELLCHNIKSEWINSNLILRDEAVFPFHPLNVHDNWIEGIKEQFLEAKSLCRSNLPFGITFSRNQKLENVDLNRTEINYFRPLNTTELKSITFTTPEEGRTFFHFWQRQRKIWWRKFSADPGRFSLTEIENEENKEFTTIQARFIWGIEPIETVNFYFENIFEYLPEQDRQMWLFETKGKKTFPCVIESTTNLDLATLCFLCDAFNEEIRLDTDLPRQLMKLHRKLAPYKTAFAIDFDGESQLEELKLLTEYLALNLKKVGIPTFFVLKMSYGSLEKMFEHYDLMGIPFVIVVKSSTLVDGIFGLRSRETTLQEQLHIDQLSTYLKKLLEN